MVFRLATPLQPMRTEWIYSTRTLQRDHTPLKSALSFGVATHIPSRSVARRSDLRRLRIGVHPQLGAAISGPRTRSSRPEVKWKPSPHDQFWIVGWSGRFDANGSMAKAGNGQSVVLLSALDSISTYQQNYPQFERHANQPRHLKIPNCRPIEGCVTSSVPMSHDRAVTRHRSHRVPVGEWRRFCRRADRHAECRQCYLRTVRTDRQAGAQNVSGMLAVDVSEATDGRMLLR